MLLISWGLGVAFADIFRAIDHWAAFLLLSAIGLKILIEHLFFGG